MFDQARSLDHASSKFALFQIRSLPNPLFTMGNLASLEKELSNVGYCIYIDDYDNPNYPYIYSHVDLSHYVSATKDMIAKGQVPAVFQLIECVKNGDLANFINIVEKCLTDDRMYNFAPRIVQLFTGADLANNDVRAMLQWTINNPKIDIHPKNFATFEDGARLIADFAPETKMASFVSSVISCSEGCKNSKCPAEDCPSHATLNVLLLGAIRRNMPRIIRSILATYYSVPFGIWLSAIEVFEPAVITELLAKFPSGTYDPSLSIVQMNACADHARNMASVKERDLFSKIYYLILVGRFDEAKHIASNDVRTRNIEHYWWADISTFLSTNWNLYDDRRHYALHTWFITNTSMIVRLNVSQIDDDMFHNMSAFNLEIAFDRWCRRWGGVWYTHYDYDMFNPPAKALISNEYLRECINRKCSVTFLKKLVQHVGKERFQSPEVCCSILKSVSKEIIAMFDPKNAKWL